MYNKMNYQEYIRQDNLCLSMLVYVWQTFDEGKRLIVLERGGLVFKETL